MGKGIEIIKVAYCCGEKNFKGNNNAAADQYVEFLEASGRPAETKAFSFLALMESYLHENSHALATIAFRDNVTFMSMGINIIFNAKLFIEDAFRLDIKHVWNLQDIPFFSKYFSSSKKYFKDYFVVSGHEVSDKSKLVKRDGWTLLIVDSVKPSDIVNVDKVMCKRKLEGKFETRDKRDNKRFYVEVKCCSPDELKDFLAELRGLNISAEHSNFYRAPDDIISRIAEQKKRKEYIKSITPKKSRKDNCYFVKN